LSTALRRALFHFFVFLVNYNLLGTALGVTLMAATPWLGPWNIWLVAGLALLTTGLSLAYQVTRHRWSWRSPGETWLGNYDKADILRQQHYFTVSRWPLLLLVVLTLVVNGNLADGLTEREGTVYSIADVLLAAALVGVQFYAISAFFTNPSLTVILPLALALFGMGIAIQFGYRTLLSDDLVTLTGRRPMAVYKGLGVIWALLGWFYARRYQLADVEPAQ
jgi:hypothetical protein